MPRTIAHVIETLSAEATRLAELGAARRAESAATARTLRLAADLVRDRRRGDDPDRAEFVVLEVAVALCVPRGTAWALVTLGEDLRDRLPAIGRALACGDLDHARARTLAERLAAIDDPALRAACEAESLAKVAGHARTTAATAAVADRVVARLAPAFARARARRAVADRELRVAPGPDGMASVSGLLSATDGRTVDHRLDVMTTQPCTADPRTHAQRRADALVALAAGRTRLRCTCAHDVCPAGAEVGDAGAADRSAGGVVVHVVVAAETLAGAADLPGVLRRMGVVDDDTVRRLAADATWRQLLTLGGTPVHLGRARPAGFVPGAGPLRHDPSAALAGLVRDRDGHCRFPGCDVDAARCDLHHVIPFDHDRPDRGGRSEPSNLAALCRHHHRAKTRDVWSVVMDPDGTQHWRGPAGQVATTQPEGLPPLPAAPPPVELEQVLADLVELWCSEVGTWGPTGAPPSGPAPPELVVEPPPF